MKLVSSNMRLADMVPVPAPIATLANTVSTSALHRSGSNAPPCIELEIDFKTGAWALEHF